jgi:hypothetical protein
MRLALILGILLIAGFVYITVTKRGSTEGFAAKKQTKVAAKADSCGSNPDDVYDSAAKEASGPLRYCIPDSQPFYKELARIKGTSSATAATFKFIAPDGTDPLAKLVPGKAPYTQALAKVGLVALNPDNWIPATGCGSNPTDVYDSSVADPTGPLKFCKQGGAPFYKELARIKGSKSSDPKAFKFMAPDGTDPLANLVPGTADYTQALVKIGTSSQDPANWSLTELAKIPTKPIKQPAAALATASKALSTTAAPVKAPTTATGTAPVATKPAVIPAAPTPPPVAAPSPVATKPPPAPPVATKPPPAAAVAAVPKPAGTSVVPNTMPGATTADSKSGLAAVKDLVAFLDTLKTFNALYEQNIDKTSKDTELQFLHATAISYTIKIQAQVDTGSIVDSLQFVTNERAKYEKSIVDLRQGLLPGGRVAIKAAGAPIPATPNGIKLADLENAIVRAKAEKRRIDELRSTSSDLKKRSATLELVTINLQEMVDKIRRGEMSIVAVPFEVKDINMFLMEIQSPASTITPLGGLKKAEPPKAKAKEKAPGMFPMPQNPNAQYNAVLQDFRRAASDLSWDIHVGYDPSTTLHKTTLDRLAHITSRIETGAVKGDALKASLLELEVLKEQLASHTQTTVKTQAKGTKNTHILKPYEKFTSQQAVNVSEPMAVETQVPVKRDVIKNLDYTSSSDWRGRPGYEMTTEKIEHRASLASANVKVSGPDYKARVRFLCSQISEAGLGDPREFGCIAHPATDVSPDYSWHGNYKMVCSRLGNTWGDWYPEMFGCPKVDTALRQTPLIHLAK